MAHWCFSLHIRWRSALSVFVLAWLCVCLTYCVLRVLCLGLQVEDLKKTLLLHGGNVSQVVKDVLSDFRKLKGVRAQQPRAGSIGGAVGVCLFCLQLTCPGCEGWRSAAVQALTLLRLVPGNP